MKLDQKNLSKMSDLRDQRGAVRQQLLNDVAGLRHSLKPTSLKLRAKNLMRNNLADVGQSATKNLHKHSTLLTVIGGGLVAAALYKPVRMLLDRVDDEVDYEAQTTSLDEDE